MNILEKGHPRARNLMCFWPFVVQGLYSMPCSWEGALPPDTWLQPWLFPEQWRVNILFHLLAFRLWGVPTKKRFPKTSNDQDKEKPVSPCDGSLCFIIPTFLTARMFHFTSQVVQGVTCIENVYWKQSGSARYSILLNSPNNPLRQVL